MNNKKRNPYTTLRPRTRPYIIKPKALVDQKHTRIIKRTVQPISPQVKHDRRGGI